MIFTYHACDGVSVYIICIRIAVNVMRCVECSLEIFAIESVYVYWKFQVVFMWEILLIHTQNNDSNNNQLPYHNNMDLVNFNKRKLLKCFFVHRKMICALCLFLWLTKFSRFHHHLMNKSFLISINLSRHTQMTAHAQIVLTVLYLFSLTLFR